MPLHIKATDFWLLKIVPDANDLLRQKPHGVDMEVEPPLRMAQKNVFRAAQDIGTVGSSTHMGSVQTPKGQMSMGTLVSSMS